MSNQTKMQSYLLIVILLSAVWSAEAWVRVRNKGGYVARFFVDYYLHSSPPDDFIEGVQLPVRLLARTLSTDNYPIGRTRVIGVPADAIAARVRVERFIFYPFFGWYWKEIFRQEIKPQAKLCFDIWGTTVHPAWSGINC